MHAPNKSRKINKREIKPDSGSVRAAGPGEPTMITKEAREKIEVLERGDNFVQISYSVYFS